MQLIFMCEWHDIAVWVVCIISYAYKPGAWFNIKMPSFQYRKYHCGDKMILRPCYLNNGISYTGKTTSLYWIRPQLVLTTLSGSSIFCPSSFHCKLTHHPPEARVLMAAFPRFHLIGAVQKKGRKNQYNIKENNPWIMWTVCSDMASLGILFCLTDGWCVCSIPQCVLTLLQCALLLEGHTQVATAFIKKTIPENFYDFFFFVLHL